MRPASNPTTDIRRKLLREIAESLHGKRFRGIGTPEQIEEIRRLADHTWHLSEHGTIGEVAIHFGVSDGRS